MSSESLGNRVDFKSVGINESSKFTKSTDGQFNGQHVNQFKSNQEKNEITFNSVEIKGKFNLENTKGLKEPKLEPTDRNNNQQEQFILLRNFNSSEFSKSSFNLSFEFRTGHLNGFIFLIPGKINSTVTATRGNLSTVDTNSIPLVNYLAVSLKSGQLVINLREFKKPILFISGDNLANDQWHIVVMKKTSKYFSVQIDTGHEMLIELNLKKNMKLYFEPAILLGGSIDTLGSGSSVLFDEIFGHKGWTSHILILKEFMAHKFKGCLREFKLNGKSVNLITRGTSLGVNCD